jgi:tetratricopeptide (TPR) repeat protein
MQDTVSLFDALLSRVRRFHEVGCWREALALLRRLADFSGLPSDTAEETQALLGEILLKHRRYRPAQQHLQQALGHCPDAARYHFLLGLALHTDPQGDKELALRHYRRSLELAPNQVRCRGEAGLLAIELGQTDEGLALLRKACEVAPQDSGAIARLVKGLSLAGQPEEALAVVCKARFRAPRCVRLRRLWIELQLACIRRQQELTTAQKASEEGPVLLPFVRPVQQADPRPVRSPQDEVTTLPVPWLVRLPMHANRRRVT